MAPYTDNENKVWATVCSELATLHKRHSFKDYLVAKKKIELPENAILQISSLNKQLHSLSTFQYHPVAGLIEPIDFLQGLEQNTFYSTQYIRHESKPFHTPEPDVIHEMIGHAPSFIIPEICRLSNIFGETAIRVKNKVQQVINVYWFTLEFGMVYEDNECKAFGAGLLSSVDELKRSQGMTALPFDLDKISQTAFDPTAIQPFYFAAESFEHLIEATTVWLKNL